MQQIDGRADQRHIARLDGELVRAARTIRLLDRLRWPDEERDRFLDGWRAGNPSLPVVEARPATHPESKAALESVMAEADRSHPLGEFIHSTARCYHTLARMMEAIGTPAFTERSVELYGRPDYVYERQGTSALRLADGLLELTDEILGSGDIAEAVTDIPADDFAAELSARLGDFFTDDDVAVVVDPDMAAKAAAGSKKVKIRGGAMFSRNDLDQLTNHEAFVHTTTVLNGKKQPLLTSMALSAPRTTKTQEGLATFSELATYSMDMSRLRRIALRVNAVQAALDGADFIDLFTFFLDAGQSPEESYQSAQRVLRGGDPAGGAAFTKDAVYLEGLALVHTFLTKAIAENRPGMIPDLFAGRLTLGDVVRLQPLFDDGTVAQPRYVPPWAQGMNRLSAYLVFSTYANRIRLERVELDRFAELEDAQTGD